MRILHFALVGVSLLCSSIGSAAPIEWIQDDRFMAFQRYVFPPTDTIVVGLYEPQVPFQSWTGATGDGAIITSNLFPDEMYGSVEGSVRSDYWPFAPPGTFEYSHPVHDVTFAIAETQLVTLDLLFYGSGNDWLDVEAALYRDGGVVLGGSSIDAESFGSDPRGHIAPLHYTATLAPGVYRLVVALHPLYTAQPEPGFHSTYHVTSFRFLFVPEPGTAALLALGLSGLGLARRQIASHPLSDDTPSKLQ